MRVTNPASPATLPAARSFNPLYAGHKPSSFPVYICTYLRFQSPICGSQTRLQKCAWHDCIEFQSPICGSQTSIGLFPVLFRFLFQSPICGSQTKVKVEVFEKPEGLFQSPICGSQTASNTALIISFSLFQSPICGSQTPSVTQVAVGLTRFNPLYAGHGSMLQFRIVW